MTYHRTLVGTIEAELAVMLTLQEAGTSVIELHMPPVPPAGRTETSEQAPGSHSEQPNTAEQGETANTKQNTTNKGYFRGRRVK